MPNTVTLFVPTLNEIEGMKAIMPRVRHEWCDQILVVDGNSTDGTLEYAREQGYKVVSQKKKGIRYAYIEGFPYVKGRYVITFSPDGNSIPEIIPKLIEKITEGYDMVIASRYASGARSEDDDIVTSFGNWLFTKTINLLHGAHYSDAMVMFRIYRTNLFTELDLHKEESYAPEKLFYTVSGIEPLLSVRCAKRRLRVSEVPANEPRRLGGKRKMHVVRWGGACMLEVLREVYYWH
jgi:glycosyltransferase involved in cell wall biosynthesis